MWLNKGKADGMMPCPFVVGPNPGSLQMLPYLGESAFEDCIKDRKMERWWWIIQVGPKCLPNCHCEREQREMWHTSTEEKAMWRWRQRFGDKAVNQGVRAATRRNGFSLKASRRSAALPIHGCSSETLISGVQNCNRIHFYCFKPPSLQNLLQQPKETNILFISSSPFFLTSR